MRVLVAEDDEALAKAVAFGLRREGMAVDIALDGDDALTHLAVNQYDVVVLDRDLPGTHGDDVCRNLVTDKSATRVLMLTHASSVKDRVEGLVLGADDYLPKPFEFAELVARIRAVGRRPATPAPAGSGPILGGGGPAAAPGCVLPLSAAACSSCPVLDCWPPPTPCLNGRPPTRRPTCRRSLTPLPSSASSR
jgi:DNA-binding response OmpR family regulator